MAVFTNFATLSYNGGSTNSNTVTGEILEALSATKTAVTGSYAPGDTVTYAVSLINTSGSALTGLTTTDDLGATLFEGATVYPLSYVDGSIQYFVNGVLQPAPTVTAGPPLAVTGISIPAGGNAILIYETNVTEFAPPATGAQITNTISVTGSGLSVPVTASETVSAAEGTALTIQKAISPSVVTENGQLTYTFTVTNTGNTEAAATDNVVLSDTFNPVLNGITVTLDGVLLVQDTDYTYNETTGEFATLPGEITVPAATYTQNPDGSWSVTPGTATLVVTGTV